jgi:nuclear transport factor 2 (NTF2) superfamily protein
MKNRSEFVNGRHAIVAFLTHKWAKEDYRFIKELCAFRENWITVRFAYEWQDDSGNWFRSYGNENWDFDENGFIRPSSERPGWASGKLELLIIGVRDSSL